MSILRNTIERLLGVELTNSLYEKYGELCYSRAVNKNRQEIRKGILLLNKESFSEKIRKGINYVESNKKIKFFLNPFYKKYYETQFVRSIRFGVDSEGGLPYVIHNGNKMYFKRSMNQKDIVQWYIGILAEQDENSPHKYRIENKDSLGIVIDGGASEGLFGLQVVEQCEHLYLVECDPDWIECLEKTFEPWKDKVTIINKYIGETDDVNTISLNSYFSNPVCDIVKLDVEGAEAAAIRGMLQVLDEQSELLVCVYHYQDEEKDVDEILLPKGYNKEVANDYVLFTTDFEQKEPYFRNCVIRYYK